MPSKTEIQHPSKTLTRSRLACAVRDHRPQAELDALRREYYTAALAEHILAVVAKAPPLTSEQRDRLAMLFRNGGGNG